MIVEGPAAWGHINYRSHMAIVGVGALLSVLTFGFVLLSYSQAFGFLVYAIIVAFCLVALFAPSYWGIATLVVFTGLAGFLKDLAGYSTFAHLGNDWVLLSVLLGHLARAANRSQPLFPADMPLKVPLAVLVFSAFALTLAPWTTPIQALGGLKAYVEPALLIPVVAVAFARARSLRIVLWALIAIGLANAVASLFEVAVGPQVVASWGPGFVRNVLPNSIGWSQQFNATWWRPFGLTQDAFAAAGLEAIAASLLFWVSLLPWQTRAWLRVASAFAAGLATLAIVQSSVRTAAVVLLVGWIGASLLARSRRPATVLLGLGLVVLVGMAYLVSQFASPVVHERLLGLLQPETLGQGRGFLAWNILETWVKAPLGIGMGKAVPASDLLSQLAGQPQEGYANENMLLSMLLELGWLGGLFVFATWWEIGRGAWKYFSRGFRTPEADASFLICVLLFVFGLAQALFVGQPVNLLLWIFGTAGLSSLRNQSEGS